MKTYKQLQERINMAKAKMGDVIKDFKDSDAPQFKGKSDEKRRQMAIAAKLSNEEVELEENMSKVINTAHQMVKSGKSSEMHSAISSAIDKHYPMYSKVTKKKVHSQALERVKQMNEDAEELDEISSDMAHRYLKGKHERDYNTSADGKSSSLKKPQSFAKMNKDMMGSMRALKTIERAKKANEEVEQTDEELKGDQHKIDANKNGKVDRHDFKLLRGKKK